MKNTVVMSLLLIVLAFVLPACGGSNSTGAGGQQTRSFKMGFTPWPYADTLSAVNDIYAFIDGSADIVAHHIDSGVPWNEATPNNFSGYG